jgi:hypothetical protein
MTRNSPEAGRRVAANDPTADPKHPVTNLLLAGIEGGGIALYGMRLADGWRFQAEYVDQTGTMIDLPEIRDTSAWTSDWDEALRHLDARGWQRFPAVYVHPEFRRRVWEAIVPRIEASAEAGLLPADKLIERWRSRCGVERPAEGR